MMRKYTEEDALLQSQAQVHETMRMYFGMLTGLAQTALEIVREHSERSDTNEAARIQIESERLRMEKERFEYDRRSTRERVSVKDTSGLCAKTLAAESRMRAKSKNEPWGSKG